MTNVVERANEIAAESMVKDREFQAQLQAPIPDALLSWKPITIWEKAGKQYAIYAPYIDDSMYRERLDDVCGMTGWDEHFTDKEALTLCDVSIIFPSGTPVTGQGVGYHSSRDKNEGNSEKGARTLAFRDACRHLGICGRDIDGAQTRIVEVEAYQNTAGGFTVTKVLEPLNRTKLRHSGESLYPRPGYVRSIVHNEADPGLMRNFDAQAAERAQCTLETTLDMTPPPAGAPKPAYKPKERGDYKDPGYVWTFGKFKGKTIAQTDDGYLKWCEEKSDFCNPGHEKYDEWMHNLVSYHLHNRAGKELEAAGETAADYQPVQQTPQQMVEEVFGEGSAELPEGF